MGAGNHFSRARTTQTNRPHKQICEIWIMLDNHLNRANVVGLNKSCIPFCNTVSTSVEAWYLCKNQANILRHSESPTHSQTSLRQQIVPQDEKIPIKTSQESCKAQGDCSRAHFPWWQTISRCRENSQCKILGVTFLPKKNALSHCFDQVNSGFLHSKLRQTFKNACSMN